MFRAEELANIVLDVMKGVVDVEGKWRGISISEFIIFVRPDLPAASVRRSVNLLENLSVISRVPARFHDIVRDRYIVGMEVALLRPNAWIVKEEGYFDAVDL